jgi:hypothetical protein
MAAHDKLDYTKAPKPIFYPDGSIGYRQWQQRPWGTEPVAVVTYVARGADLRQTSEADRDITDAQNGWYYQHRLGADRRQL